MKPRIPALAACGLLALAPSLARADFNLQLSVKWEPLRYVVPQQPTLHDDPSGGVRNVTNPADPGASGTAPLPGGSAVSMLQRQNLGATLGLGFTDKLAVLIGLDIARASVGHEDSDASAITQGFTTLGFSLGLKFNFKRPRKETISPYVYADFFKYFTALNDDHPNNLTQSEVEFSAGLSAPFGFRVAFGVEYYFSDSFALGAEIFGLQGSFSSGDMRRNEQGAIVSHSQSLSSIALYTAFTLSFRFNRLFRSRPSYRELDRDYDRGRYRSSSEDRDRSSSRYRSRRYRERYRSRSRSRGEDERRRARED